MKVAIEYDDTISTLKNEKQKVDSFHNAVGPVGQLFGLMPVSGILNKDTRNVRFKWISVRSVCSFITVFLTIIEISCLAITVVKNDNNISLGIVGSTIFFVVCLFGNISFIRMAIEWPQLIRLWRKSEDVFLRAPYKKWKRSLAFDLRGITLSVMLLSILEHGLYVGSSVFNNKKQIDDCHLNVSFFRNLYYREKEHLAKQIPFNGFIYTIFKLNNIAMTFTWSFIDIFIMALSMGIARRFNQINDRLQTARGKLLPESFWIEIRTHYLAMAELLQYVDERVSSMILVSCANNMYFICIELFNGYHVNPLPWNKVYFWVALAFIFTRTLLMLFCASSIHDAAKKPLTVLRCVPSVAFSVEMAGTVATYELVLIDTVNEKRDPVDICDKRSLTNIILGD